MPPRPNVAVVELGSSDEVTITMLGQCPAGVPARHEFKGQGLKQIDAIMLDLGVHVVVWLVPEMPIFSSHDLPLVLIDKMAIQPPSDDRWGNLAVLAKIQPGEPFFVLRGQDKLAVGAVRHWANAAEAAGVSQAKVDNARKCAWAMQAHRPVKVPD